MYTAKDIRNLALLGHGGDGKSALCESMLYVTKAITRLGKRADGTTVSDFDDEEKKRQYSIKTSVIPVEFGGCKLNVLDNPGYFDFAAEIVQSLRVADAGLICLTAKSGIAVGTEKGWKSLADAGLPAMFYVSKLDEEHANFFNTFDSLRDIFGASVIPFTFPILHGEEAVGVVDLVSKKAYDVSGKEIVLPAEAEEKIEEYMAELNEQVAETDEALMEKFFMEEPFTEEELLKGIKEGIRQRSVTPVFCGCAMNGLGTLRLLENIVKFAPNRRPAGQPRPLCSVPAGGQACRPRRRGRQGVRVPAESRRPRNRVRVQHRRRPVRQELLLQGPLWQHRRHHDRC